MLSETPSPVGTEDPAAPAPRTVDYDWMSAATWREKHAAQVALAQRGGADLLFVGDSITEGWEWGEAEAWRRHFVPLRAANLGIGGDTTQNLLWRLDHGAVGTLRPRVVVVLIGINNLGRENATPEAAVRGIRAVVAKVRALFPESRILLHGVFPSGHSSEDEIRRRVAAVNRQLQGLDTEGGRMVFRDIGGIFVEPDGAIPPEVMPDGLHLSAEGYRRWAEAILPTVGGMLGGGPG